MRDGMHDQLCAADFDTLPQRRRGVIFDNTVRMLEVVEIVQLRAGALRSAPPFAVLLRDNGVNTSMPQGTYLYHHPVHGELTLFTVPQGPDAHGMRYELVFN